jgi:hypothetical protein
MFFILGTDGVMLIVGREDGIEVGLLVVVGLLVSPEKLGETV